jgi:hypothetical protein
MSKDNCRQFRPMNREQQGPMAKWIRRLTTDQEIPGSIPGRFDVLARMHKPQVLLMYASIWIILL